MKLKKLLAALSITISLVLASPFALAAATADEIAGRLACQCGGCSLAVTECDHEGCPSAGPIHEQVKDMVAEGQTEDAIIGNFVNTYGAGVLYTAAAAAPSGQDSGHEAGVFPFIAILLAGVVAFFVLSKLTGRSKQGGRYKR